ncbi:MAG: zonular occludens toxin domain-containing protein [Roseateles sp.]|uniref:zonular occludens toxin domain-containing protein n=1 Tax=Roseateles sp. TaxID=1971397 RepID=UPI0039E9F477
MIIFHEGLPGSGKSYEAMAVRIIPAIKAGREVVAYVEGIDHKKIAEIAGVSEERCRELLHVLTRDQMKSNWVELCRDNALHVFDEAQNFWGNRVKLNEVQTCGLW